ncbi:MAG: hypothetical protein SFY95_13110 [Planctomycetota bacterium]|nr:hypothetical protein [Planctomycetota bacterium]
MRVVSFFTGDGVYRQFAEKLRASCERFGVPYDIDEFPSTGDWIRNLAKKPRFLLDKLDKHRGPVVWMDADCEICQEPAVLREASARGDVDFMCYNLFADAGNGLTEIHDPTRLHSSSGVMYIADTPAARGFIAQWGEMCEENPDQRDDFVLNYTFARRRNTELRARWLPREYNRMDMYFPQTTPVINHVYRDGQLFIAKPKA